MTRSEIKKMLTYTEHLMNHIYWFKQDFVTNPEKEHVGMAVNYTDIKERKADFIRQLINTITNWVYSKQKVQELLTRELEISGNDYGYSMSQITTSAFNKFRPGNPQGQFGELLLFNFIQYFFEAAPVLRKMKITTSTGHERFGADAIHYTLDDSGRHIFILGESKCYESTYQFNSAFKASVESICSTFDNIDSELNLYIYDDFIESELQSVAEEYKRGTLTNVRFELVCLIVYNENKEITGSSEDEIKESIQAIIEKRLNSTKAFACFSNKPQVLLDRINYIIFPIWGLDKLLDNFSLNTGISK